MKATQYFAKQLSHKNDSVIAIVYVYNNTKNQWCYCVKKKKRKKN